MKHPDHDKILAALNGEVIQYSGGNPKQWIDFANDSENGIKAAISNIVSFHPDTTRIKPRTIMIGGVEVPEPMRVAPACGVTYWGVFLNEPSIDVDNWQGMDCEVRWLKTGLLHATEQGAQQMLAALVKQLGGVL